MKRKISLLLIISLCFMLTPSNFADAAKVKISKSSAIIYAGKTTTLKISGTKKSVRWRTDNNSIASVNSNGKVTGKKKGTAVITAKVGLKKYTCSITVKNRITASASSIDCVIGSDSIITFSIKGEKENEGLIAWTDPQNIASAEWEESGNKHILYIEPLAPGKTSLNIYLSSGYGINQKYSKNGSIKVDIYVFEDSSGWISQTALEKYKVSTYTTTDGIRFSYGNKESDLDGMGSENYTISRKASALENNVVYTSDSINYKFDGTQLYFSIKDLKTLKII